MSVLPPSPLLDETISPSQAGHIGDHEEIHTILNDLLDQVAVLPPEVLQFMFVAPFGDDAADGRTWGTAKATVSAAVALISGMPGVINIAPGVINDSEIVHETGHDIAGSGYGATTLRLTAGANTGLLESDGFVALASGGGGSGPGTSSGGTYGWRLRDILIDGQKSANTSTVPLLRYFGYDYTIEHVRVINSDNIGMYAEWGNDPGDPGPAGMEATITDVKIAYSGSHGLVWRGPHDSEWTNIIVFENADRGFWIQDNGGALIANGCHSWGNAQSEPWFIEAQVLATNCTAEGGNGIAQVVLAANDIQWLGGQVFAAGGTAKGFRLGNASPVIGIRVQAKVLNCTDGAVDFHNDGGGNDLDLLVFHAPATAVFPTGASRNGGTSMRSIIVGAGTGGNANLWPHESIFGAEQTILMKGLSDDGLTGFTHLLMQTPSTVNKRIRQDWFAGGVTQWTWLTDRNGDNTGDLNLFGPGFHLSMIGNVNGKVGFPDGLAAGNVAATTPGSVVKKIHAYDEFGNSIGWIPVYDTIT